MQAYAVCSGESKNFVWKGGGGGSVFIIANAHNEIYAFYTKNSGFLKKIWANRGRGYTF